MALGARRRHLPSCLEPGPARLANDPLGDLRAMRVEQMSGTAKDSGPVLRFGATPVALRPRRSCRRRQHLVGSGEANAAELEPGRGLTGSKPMSESKKGAGQLWNR